MDKPPIQQDEQYRRAVAIVMEAGRASVSMVQRKLNIRYSTAQELICRMLRDGLVGIEDTPGVPAEMAWAAAAMRVPDKAQRQKLIEAAITKATGEHRVLNDYDYEDVFACCEAALTDSGVGGRKP